MLKSRSEAMAACGFRDRRGIVVVAQVNTSGDHKNSREDLNIAGSKHG